MLFVFLDNLRQFYTLTDNKIVFYTIRETILVNKGWIKQLKCMKHAILTFLTDKWNVSKKTGT